MSNRERPVTKVLVSACLLGNKVRYDGRASLSEHSILHQWIEEGRVIPICPEVSGGMSIPRDPAEIKGGDGYSVIAEQASVLQENGNDVTKSFLQGANNALVLCQENNIKVAVLTESSPSCGSSSIYNGSFSRSKTDGVGVTTALLIKHGIQVFNQHQFMEANKALQ